MTKKVDLSEKKVAPFTGEPEKKFTRIKGEYSNKSPMGIASELHNS